MDLIHQDPYYRSKFFESETKSVSFYEPILLVETISTIYKNTSRWLKSHI